MAKPDSPLRGFLNVDKPAGISSFEVVRRIRRAAGVRRVGHAGTLDPAATGVLPVALGEATKLIEEVMSATKRYRGVITLGVETDTYDADGSVVARADASSVAGVSQAALEEALAAFRGEIEQVPPAYSAVKRKGVPAYRAARAGRPYELAPRTIAVYSLTLLAVALPEVTVEVECGKGFYMRALAHDLGQRLGVGAHLSALRRTAVGRFRVEQATPLDVVAARLEQGDVETLLEAPDAVLTAWPALILARASVGATRLGREVQPPPAALRRAARPGERARGYGPEGWLEALLEPGATPGTWHPYRVFAPVPRTVASDRGTFDDETTSQPDV